MHVLFKENNALGSTLVMINKAWDLIDVGKSLVILLYTIQYLILNKTIIYKMIKNIY